MTIESKAGTLRACAVATVLFILSQPVLSQDIQHGKDIFRRNKCAECHSVLQEGGCLGPALDGVMERRELAYVRLRLGKGDEDRFIKMIGHPELMPHPRFNKTQVLDLIAFLKTLHKIESNESQQHHELKNKNAGQPAKALSKSTGSAVAEGKALIYKNGCLACHSVGGLGGSTGPQLDGVALRRSRQSIEDFIAAPRSKGSTPMPNPSLSASERRKIAEYLLTLSPAIK